MGVKFLQICFENGNLDVKTNVSGEKINILISKENLKNIETRNVAFCMSTPCKKLPTEGRRGQKSSKICGSLLQFLKF